MRSANWPDYFQNTDQTGVQVEYPVAQLQSYFHETDSRTTFETTTERLGKQKEVLPSIHLHFMFEIQDVLSFERAGHESGLRNHIEKKRKLENNSENSMSGSHKLSSCIIHT